MFLLLLSWIESFNVSIPQMFFYTTFKMLMASISSFVLTLICGKFFIAKLVSLKVGHRVRVSDCAVLAGVYDKHKEIPSMGGVLFIFTIIISNFLWMDIQSPYGFLFTVVLITMGAIGFVDDYLKIKEGGKGISAKTKFLLQLAVAFFISHYLYSEQFSSQINSMLGVSIPQIKGVNLEGGYSLFMNYIFIPFCKNPIYVTSTVILYLFSMFVLIGSANAVNLTDGLDGLAAGCTLLVAAVFSIIAFISNHMLIAEYLNILYIQESGQIAIFLCSLIGSLLGFLWFNSYPAQVFMGDTGSLVLGTSMGLVSILLRREFLLALVGGIFVVETLSVILQVFSYKFFGRRIFSCAPIHHHFEIKGWHESKIVIRFWMIGLILALVGLVSIKIQ